MIRHFAIFASLALVGLLPTLQAAAPAAQLFVFPGEGGIFLDVRYDDGLASTKFGFVQLAGQGGGPTQRLVAGALCTEWDGTFSQVLVKARASDHASAATLSMVGALSAHGSPRRDAPGFDFDAMGGPGAFEGTLTICDDAAGEGRATFRGGIATLPLLHANPATVRITEE